MSRRVYPSRTISYLHPYLHLIRFNSLLIQFNRFVTNQSLNQKVTFFNPWILIRTKTAFGFLDRLTQNLVHFDKSCINMFLKILFWHFGCHFIPHLTVTVIQVQLKLFFRVSVNYGVFIKLTADILEIPCVGNNGIYIEEKGGRAGPFCAKKKMPAFVSRDVFFDIHIIVDTPLEVSFLLLNCRCRYELPKLSFLEHVPTDKSSHLDKKTILVSHYPYIIRINFN